MVAEDARRRVVVGVDGSPEALRAVRWAAREAVARSAELHLVAAILWTDDRLPGVPAIGRDRTGDVLRRLAEAALETAEAVAVVVAPDVVVVRREIVGFPAAVLCEEGRHAQLLVVGDRGRGRVASLMAGSVAVAVVSHAACPVVVVRGADGKDAEEAAAPDETGPVVVGIDGTPRSEAASRFAFEALRRRQGLVAPPQPHRSAGGPPRPPDQLWWRTVAGRSGVRGPACRRANVDGPFSRRAARAP